MLNYSEFLWSIRKLKEDLTITVTVTSLTNYLRTYADHHRDLDQEEDL